MHGASSNSDIHIWAKPLPVPQYLLTVRERSIGISFIQIALMIDRAWSSATPRSLTVSTVLTRTERSLMYWLSKTNASTFPSSVAEYWLFWQITFQRGPQPSIFVGLKPALFKMVITRPWFFPGYRDKIELQNDGELACLGHHKQWMWKMTGRQCLDTWEQRKTIFEDICNLWLA